MPALIERLTAGRCGLWLEYSDYAGALLAQGEPPWLAVDAMAGWQRKAQGLLKSDVIGLPLARVVAAWLPQHPELAAAMAGKRRAVFPLKTLLADAALRTHLLQLAGALRASFAELPLALLLPAPRAWVALAYAQAFSGEAVEVDEDAVDAAAAYVADFLRAFADCGVDALLLQEQAVTPELLQLYQAVFNLAAHYRWELGLQLAQADGVATGGAQFCIAPQAAGDGIAGVAVPAAFWNGAAAPACPPGGFRFAEIPAGAQPEAVLERLAALR
jgi:hypothetical protein